MCQDWYGCKSSQVHVVTYVLCPEGVTWCAPTSRVNWPSYTGQELNDVEMSILRCHQQRRRSVVGLLCQLGFYVWPVTWQELDQKNVKTS